MSETCPRCLSKWCSGTVDRRCAKIQLARSLWWGCYVASYQIAFDWAPWKAEDAGVFTGLRAAFHAFGPAMQCYGLTAQGLGPAPKKAVPETDDKVAKATEIRGSLLEFD